MNAAKFTLTATVLAAAFGLTLGLMSAPAAAHDCLRHGDPNHKHCDDVGGGGIEYEATLTGAFVFDSVVVSPNTRENELRSEDNLNFDLSTSGDSVTWVDMFDTCAELWDPGPVEAFFVGEDDWTIAKAGGVRVVFRHIEDQGAEFRFQLIGDEFDFIDSFLPTPGLGPPADTRTYTLDQFAITAKSLSGGSGGTKFCRTLGGDPLFLTVPSTLVITAPE